MADRVLSSLVPQRVLNTIAAALMLLSAPVLAPAVEGTPPTAVIALNESATAAELARQLPVVLSFSDRMGTAGIAQLPVPLAIEGTAQVSGYRAGDIAYLASEQSVIVFLSDGMAVPDGGLVLIGHVASGSDGIAGCVRHCALELAAGARWVDTDR